jgi:hypothetical protein
MEARQPIAVDLLLLLDISVFAQFIKMVTEVYNILSLQRINNSVPVNCLFY